MNKNIVLGAVGSKLKEMVNIVMESKGGFVAPAGGLSVEAMLFVERSRNKYGLNDG